MANRADIETCQSLGKTILLSIGGATYTEGGFDSESAAIAGAELLWQTFGPIPSNTSVHRPFGNAVVDGFDFDFESTVSNMAAFANQLRTFFSDDSSKKYYLTAAPQCPYPDAADNPMLDGSVYFDAIWVQFYNNYCGLQSYVVGSSTQNNFDFSTWDTWARTTSLNPNVKVFLGVPGGTTAAGSGYEPVSALTPIINYVQGFRSFGGVMIWDASQAYANSGFISGLASALSGASSSPHPSTVTRTTTTTTTTSWTTTTATWTTTTTVVTTTSTTTISSCASMTSRSTSTAPTATSTASTCPVAGASCSRNGAYVCNGSGFGICSNGKWVVEQCGTNLICVQNGPSVYCNVPGSGPDTSCS